MAYQYTNSNSKTYTLYSKDLVLKSSNYQSKIYYFAVTSTGNPVDEIPDGWTVVENPKNKLPLLRRVK